MRVPAERSSQEGNEAAPGVVSRFQAETGCESGNSQCKISGWGWKGRKARWRGSRSEPGELRSLIAACSKSLGRCGDGKVIEETWSKGSFKHVQ